jgi:Holliday junction resolvase-like predicted endonuclease
MNPSLSNFSISYLLSLLYTYKSDVDKACEKYLIPKTLFEEVYELFKESLEDLDFRIDIIEELLSRGESPEKIAEAMDWRDFEYLVGRYFTENGFKVDYNYRIHRPKREVDVLARRGGMLIGVDCKNWDKRLTRSMVRNVVEKQVERLSYLCSRSEFRGYKIYPLVVVMRRGRNIFYNGVGIIPISGLREFIQNLDIFIIEGLLSHLPC